MEREKLEKANELDKKIREYKEALNCFQWEDNDGGLHSTNPALIIEFDNDGREQIKLPMTLSDSVVNLLKEIITASLETTQKEFNNL